MGIKIFSSLQIITVNSVNTGQWVYIKEQICR